jgi:hypothetical protein
MMSPTTTATTTTAVTLPARRTAVESATPEAEQHCLVCYDVLRYAAKTPCGHDEICGVCHLRLRHLHKEKKCPICKTDNAQVIVDEGHSTHKAFADYPIWGDDLGSDYVYRENVGMFFRRAYYETDIRPLFGYHCTEPRCNYDGKEPDKNIYEALGEGNHNKQKSAPTPIRGLQDHLRVKHRLSVCQLCVDHQRDFVARLPRFTPSLLKQHLSKGDGPGSGFEGHPICEFCRPKRYYDLNYLHQHLNKDHYKCHICEQQGVANQFFKNYKSLEKHFDTRHFMCHDVQCLQARFVVFGSELDLRHHERQIHGGTSTGSTKIQLEFRVRRQTQSTENAPAESDFNYNLDGQAFVPDNLPQTASNNTDIDENETMGLHPVHVERTALLREQAAGLRDAQDPTEAFPSLEAAMEGQPNVSMRLGWASGATTRRIGAPADVGAVTENAFPSLGGEGGPGRGGRPLSNATAKLKAASANRQFAAMQQAAAAPTPSRSSASWGDASTPAVPVSSMASARIGGSVNRQANLSANNFPSLGQTAPARQPYAAANALYRQQQQATASRPPNWNSASDFPPVPTASGKSTVRGQMLSGASRSNRNPTANVLQVPTTTASAKATLEDMKATMGSVKYKALKRLTAEFASGSIDGHGYVDTAASLFDRGYGDSDFWKFLPTLLASCPNEYEAHQALQYMDNLKRMKHAASNAEAQQRSAQPVVAAAPASWNAPAPSAVSSRPVIRPGRGGGKTNSWGAGNVSSVVRAKAPPGSTAVAAAAAAAKPSNASATKFMAKEAKQQTFQQANAGKNGKKKKGKQSDELRQLAFGN